ncbi:GntR family transcriptional regulator [Clostridium tagluense]|uniref:TrkA C-terminal domain-containing protein n=1 Tax=Clostridium tagluense TaxID=360422 RepID=UPI001C0D202E|nr:TrkA C-terminal domain-containing protein [Clostridium tagluense]MBU3126891.1 GntR family transcriptional regulator [Clostridium tagluense]MCB2299455.1 GntR family transcriptional regulator [Clostridium tagluense]MCB2310565.1 GntR family transcriptional regulator [Clostridium tagluense]MCB2315269.1 GntR family transcriptional regulator [Clostridium tagluense]MCB2320120.1 GntR family transcriptional regulator [Clostridium tagluense]
MPNNSTLKPIYQKIAIDIANRIVSGDLSIGDKLHGRSSLASQYNVSPETVRRSVSLLSQMDIVKVTKGSGIVINSVDNCLQFIDKFKDIDSISSIKKNIVDLLEKKKELDKNIEHSIDELVDYSSRFKNSNPFIPFEFEIHSEMSIINKTISQAEFWQNTGATIIGIRRDDKLILSPGPTTIFKDNDIFIVICSENSYYRIKDFLNKK